MENNNKKYDKFYFLHIPKTGGRYFKKIAAYPLSLESKKKGKNLTFLIPPAHNGWIPEIDENTYVVSIVRDPVKLVCSWRLYFGNDGKNQGLDMNDEHFLKIVKDGMFSHLRKENWLHNFQSKNLTKHYKYFNGPENYEEVDEKLLYENIKRIDFLFTQDYLESNPVDVCRKIFSDHEESFTALELPEYNNFRQANSKILYDSLSKDEIEEIKSYFKLDIEIYNMVRNREV